MSEQSEFVRNIASTFSAHRIRICVGLAVCIIIGSLAFGNGVAIVVNSLSVVSDSSLSQYRWEPKLRRIPEDGLRAGLISRPPGGGPARPGWGMVSAEEEDLREPEIPLHQKTVAASERYTIVWKKL